MTKKGGAMEEEILAAIQAISEKIRQLRQQSKRWRNFWTPPWTRTKKPALSEDEKPGPASPQEHRPGKLAPPSRRLAGCFPYPHISGSSLGAVSVPYWLGPHRY